MALALAIPPDIVQFVKTAKEFTPQIGRMRLPGGAIISLIALAPVAQEQMEAAVARNVRVRTRVKKSDNKQVVKVKDAIECIEKNFTEQGFQNKLLNVARGVVGAVATLGLLPDNQLNDAVSKIIDDQIGCIRKKALKQSHKRKYQTRIYMRRQGRGPA